MHRTAAALACLLASSCGATGQVVLENDTGATLTYCPIEAEPPPPHRECHARFLKPGARFSLDLEDFQPVYWEPLTSLGVIVQHDFELAPYGVLVGVYRYQVPPGRDAGDPDKQPQKLAEYPMVLTDPDQRVRIVLGNLADRIPVTFEDL